MEIVQAHFGKIDNLRNEMVNKNIDFTKKHKIKHTLITEWPDKYDMPDTNDFTVLSECLRFYLAAENDNMCWVDTDAKIINLWSMEEGKPYFNFFSYKTMDYSIFAVNKCSLWFKKLIMEYKKRGIQPGYMSWAKVLRDKDNQVNSIDYIYFEHFALTFHKWQENRKSTQKLKKITKNL